VRAHWRQIAPHRATRRAAVQGQVTPKADNTAINTRDKSGATQTPQKQANDADDRKLVAEIRRAVVQDKSLSTSAHNVKIIANSGVVTLRGPVSSEEEKAKSRDTRSRSRAFRVLKTSWISRPSIPNNLSELKMKHAVYCIARNLIQAETIVQSLRQAGFNSNEISVLLPDKSGTRDLPTRRTPSCPKGRPRVGRPGWVWEPY
jgi:hypothetical protein